MASRCASLSRSLMLLPSGLCACGQLVFSSHWSMIIAVCAVSTLGFCGLQFLLWVLCLSCIGVCMQSACASLLLSAGLCACRQLLSTGLCACRQLGTNILQCLLWDLCCSGMGSVCMLPSCSSVPACASLLLSAGLCACKQLLSYWPLCL